jgi:hypothetical protein
MKEFTVRKNKEHGLKDLKGFHGTVLKSVKIRDIRDKKIPHFAAEDFYE